MDLNILLWVGGMLFSLGIFAIKVGLGLGLDRMPWKGIGLTLSAYLILFIVISVLSESLIKFIEPVLKKGPYLHALMALGMIAWGLFLLKRGQSLQIELKPKTENREILSCKSGTSGLNSLLLLIPCPVCLTAITFSIWSALHVIKLPAVLIGLSLGLAFVLLSLAVYLVSRPKGHRSSPLGQRIRLGLTMIAIGLYFIASLYIPAKIQEAQGVYQAFVEKGVDIDINQGLGVFGLLLAASILGYLAYKKKEV